MRKVIIIALLALVGLMPVSGYAQTAASPEPTDLEVQADIVRMPADELEMLLNYIVACTGREARNANPQPCEGAYQRYKILYGKDRPVDVKLAKLERIWEILFTFRSAGVTRGRTDILLAEEEKIKIAVQVAFTQYRKK